MRGLLIEEVTRPLVLATYVKKEASILFFLWQRG